MLGLDGNDVLKTASGDDWVYGGTGNDTIDGGSGDDHLYGEAGNDSLVGGSGNDTVTGGAKDDAVISGGDGTDTLSGGAGDDLLLAGNGGDDSISGGAGDDKIVVTGSNSTIDGGAGDDVIDAANEASDGNMTTVKFGDGSGHDYITFKDEPFVYNPSVTLHVSNVAVIDMSDLDHTQITLDYDKIVDSHLEGSGDFEGWSWDTYKGDAVLETRDGSTIYIGPVTETVTHSPTADYYEFSDSPSVDLRFADGDFQVYDVFQDEPHVNIESVSSFLHAPDAWA